MATERLRPSARGPCTWRSRNDKDFARRYPAVAKALAGLPGDSVIDGEIGTLDQDGRPFNALQNHASAAVVYCVVDLMVREGKDVMKEPGVGAWLDLERHSPNPRLVTE